MNAGKIIALFCTILAIISDSFGLLTAKSYLLPNLRHWRLGLKVKGPESEANIDRRWILTLYSATSIYRVFALGARQ